MLHAALDASGNVHLHTFSPGSAVNLIHVPRSDPEYQIISSKFYDGWKHPKAVPTIERIFYVAYSSAGLAHLGMFSEYSNKVGNTQLLFHGTRRVCRIGDSPENVTCCNHDNCNLCSILRGSYNMERAQNARMFGPGIYSTAVSSKADIYCSKAYTTQRHRVMIVNHVALGRSKTMYEASHDMQHAPHLYNSVVAATVPEGGKVQYHEAVVYREDAICANAIIVYS
ncbi:ADP-ribosylation [Agrocybe pediades]|nr:ADP-ribosylation [Agrocybe pediades]